MSDFACTILIVEDFLPDQELYRRSLLADGSHAYRFLAAETAEEALELCQTQPVDAILLDYSLPDADGLMFLETLQQRFNGGSPPVVIITGQGDETVAARAFKLGAEDYLVKSRFTPDMLRLSVRSAIENARLRLQLRQKDERFRVSIENMLDCFGICSAIRNEAGRIVDFRIDYLNAAAMQSNQATAADIGRRLCEMYPAHRETGLFEAYCRVVETGEPLAREELIFSDMFGRQFLTRAFDIHASKLDDGLVLSWRDVTARKQAELERQQQQEREQIVHRITQQIRRSLDLNEVLNAAVTEIRQHLSTDRAFLYRFEPDFSGRIMVESVSQGLPTVIGAEVQDTCFMETQGEDYRQGRIQAVADIYTAGLTDCHVEMLARFQIRANLVVPILQGERLWGLLVLSQCACPRSWQPPEVDLVQQLAAQIGIAIQQAELYQQMQESQQRLELSLESSQQGIWDYDIVSDRAYWSPQCKRLFGLEPDSSPVSMEQFLGYVHPDDRDRVVAAVQALYQTNQDYDIEHRVVWADGTVHWLHAQGKCLRNGQGQPYKNIGTVVDISQRKQTEAALLESEERLSLAIQGAGMATWDMNLRTGRAFWSEGHFRMLGYEPNPSGEGTIEMWRSRVYPDDFDRVIQAKEQARLTRSLYTLEYRIVRADNGEVRWLQVFGRYWYNECNEATRFVGIFFDTTEQKQTERQLRESEARLQLGVQVAGLAIAQVDYTSNQVTLSPEAAMLYGFAADQSGVTSVVTREQIHATFHPEERDELFAMIQQVLDPAGNGWFAREHRVVWQTGEVRWLSVRKQVFFDRSGAVPRPDYAILAAIDITAEKATEAVLRESEAHLRYTVELNPQVPWMADPEGRITRFSDRWLELTGMTREQAAGDGWVQAPHPDDRPAMVAAWTHSIQTGEPYDIEHRIRLADGSYRWMRSRAFPRRSEQGEIVQWYGTTEDISDRKQIEFEREELLQREQSARAEAEAANRGKDEFVTLVAHELRSPLNAILGWAQLLQSRRLDAATTVKALETIARNTQAQVQLVEDLLDVSRMVRGSLPLTLESVNLQQVIEEAIETVRPTAAAKGVRLETQLDPVAPISGDASRLRQVVLNLLTNAIKFTPAAGQVEVRLDQQDTEARLQVRDTGKGISPDFLPHIFERFRQDQQNATAKQGLGLGLAIVKHLVEGHGGTVTVESPGEGLGATFTVLLPRLQSELAGEQGSKGASGGAGEQGSRGAGEQFTHSPTHSPTHPPLTGLRVLLVDDEPDMLDLTAVILEEHGAIVQTAPSAAAALAQWQTFQPDLLLSDIAMPEQDGYALLQQVRRLEADRSDSPYPTAPMPAIALTAYTGDEQRDRSLQAGFKQHLTKPVDPEALIAAILNAIERQAG